LRMKIEVIEFVRDWNSGFNETEKLI
jgi:hypothetical protein